MNAHKNFKKKINSFLYNHMWLKTTSEYLVLLFMSVIASALLSFSVVCFMKPDIPEAYKLVTGGATGFAQNIVLLLEVCGLKFDAATDTFVFSILFVVVNVPLIVLAFKGVGKRFAIFTIVNVILVFVFSNLIQNSSFFEEISIYIYVKGGILARTLIAGLCTGLSSAIAFKYETSTGGFDIVSYYVSIKRGGPAGPIGAIINGFVVCAYYLMKGFQGQNIPLNDSIVVNGQTITEIGPWSGAIVGAIFSVGYLIMTMIMVDLINVRNKKVQIQIITENNDLPKYLLASVPHGATIVKGKGAYSGNDRLIVYLVVSTTELKDVIKFIREIDPKSFVNVTSLQQVYGRFYMRPVR
ncbi:MAG TPA: hypothetical protein DDW20_02010 [Firmicutes bacterium]|nr:hypothetical protein [Bacillota bacterium]